MKDQWTIDGDTMVESGNRKQESDWGGTSRALLDCSFFSPGPSTILIPCLVESLLNNSCSICPYFSPTYVLYLCCFHNEFEMVEKRDAFLMLILLPWYFFSLSADRRHVTRLTYFPLPTHHFFGFFLVEEPDCWSFRSITFYVQFLRCEDIITIWSSSDLCSAFPFWSVVRLFAFQEDYLGRG
jgi:hypothetical protein